MSTQYIDKKNCCYQLLEKGNKEGQGKSSLIVNVGDFDNICVSNYDKKKRCEFFTDKWGMKKCIDHFILRYCSNAWELHMIEIKRTVDSNNWLKIKNQESQFAFFC